MLRVLMLLAVLRSSSHAACSLTLQQQQEL